MNVVGPDQRQTLGIGEIEQLSFDAPLVVLVVALQFDVQAIVEQSLQPLEQMARRRKKLAWGMMRSSFEASYRTAARTAA